MKKPSCIISFFLFVFLVFGFLQVQAQKTLPVPQVPVCVCVLPAATTTSVSCYGGSDGTATVLGHKSGTECPYEEDFDDSHYTWNTSPVQTGRTATNLPVGTYICTWDEQLDCFKTRTVTITGPPDISGTMGHNNATCGQSDGTVSINSVGGGSGSGYSYSWKKNGNPFGGNSSALLNVGPGNYVVTVTDGSGCTKAFGPETVGNNGTAVNITSTPTTPACFGASNGSASVSATGGSGYTYSWTPGGQATQTANNLAAGTYTVTVTSSAGCSDQATATVAGSSQITSTGITSGWETCGNGQGSATINGVSGGAGAYSYSWNTMPVQTGPTANNLSQGTYSVTVTDANNCTRAFSTTIGNSVITLTGTQGTTNHVSCNGGNDGSASVSANNGTPIHTFYWQAPVSNFGSSMSNLQAGTYYINITDANGCTGTTSVTINEPQLLTCTASQTSPATCGNADGDANASAGGGTFPYAYSWYPYGSGANPANLSAGNYTVTVTDGKGCTAQDYVTITSSGSVSAVAVPTASVSCFGGTNGGATVTPSGGTGLYTYSWAPSGASVQSPNNLAAGNHTVTVTDGAGCVGVDIVQITQPPVLTASVSTAPAKCGTNVGTANANAGGGSPGFTYLWSPGGATTPIVSNLAPGAYQVTVTDSKGCTKTSSGTVISTPAVTASIASSSSVTCNGAANGSATATVTVGSPPYTYAWSPSGGNAQTGTGLSAGNYAVTITDNYGCTKTPTVSIAQPAAITATVNVTPTACAVNNGVAAASAGGGAGGFSYVWNTVPAQSAATATGLGVGTYTVTVKDANNCMKTSTATVTYSTSVTANIASSTTIACNGAGTGAATATVTAGSAPYTYVWTSSPAQSAQTATGLVAGTYSVNITDNLSCKKTVTVSITQPSAITATVSTTQTPCGQSTGTASAPASGGTGSIIYLWNNGQTTSTATGLAAGTYTCTVKDANNCTKSFVALVTNLNAHTVSVTPTPVTCFGGTDGSAISSVSGGTLPYTYSWSSGATTTSVSGLSAGNYILTVTDASVCITSKSFTVTQSPKVMANVIDSTVDICMGYTNTIGANASGGVGTFSYAWAPAALLNNSTLANPTAHPTVATIYTVTVTDKDGCTGVGTVSVSINSLPNITAGPNVTICNGASTTLGANGGTSYSWTPAAGLSNTTIANPVATPASPTSYIVTGTDAKGCFNKDTVTINLVATPTVNVTASATSICSGTSVTLTATTNATAYSWNTGQTTSSAAVVPGSTTTYSVTVFTGNCSAANTITIITSPTPTATISGSGVLCIGKSQTLSAPAGNYSYLWSTGSTASAIAISPTTNTTYSLTVTSNSNNTCYDTAMKTVTIAQNPVVTTSATYTTICAGSAIDTLTATGGSAYLWSPGGGTTASIAVNFPTPGTKNYTVLVTSSSGCTSTGTLSVTATNGFAIPVVVPNTSLSFCVGATMPTFTATPNPSTNGIAWSLGSTTITATGPTFTPPQNLTPNTYPLYCVQGTGTSCLSLPDVKNIVIHPLPNANAGNGTTVCPGYSAQLNGSGGVIYAWSPSASISNPNISNPTAEPELTTTYVVTVTDANNCRKNDSVVVHVVLNDTCLVVIYNMISPNGDGDNDVWWIDGIRFFPENNVKIFNRWGMLVWEGSGYDNDKVVWKGDGKHGGKLPEATYFYIIDIGNKKFNGFVELVH